MKQSVTSANTSINSKRLPAIYGKIHLNEGDRVLDYGCGRYTEHLFSYCLENHAEMFPFDPFNIPEWKNRETREKLENRPATVGIMSNVLNVIDSDEAIRAAIIDALSLISGKLYITVYEGDKTGHGKYTSNDSFQRNRKRKTFVRKKIAVGRKILASPVMQVMSFTLLNMSIIGIIGKMMKSASC